jgi:hypothetical protein
MVAHAAEPLYRYHGKGRTSVISFFPQELSVDCSLFAMPLIHRSRKRGVVSETVLIMYTYGRILKL